MASPSPPKPWERGAGATSASAGLASAPTATATASIGTTTSNPPALPDRPTALNSVVNRTASNYSSYNNNRFGASPYGYGGLNSYSSPYSRFGGGYGSMYGMGGMSGMGGMYGMGGMGGMYGGGMGMPMDPNNPQSLTQSFSQSTQATFQLIESIVGAFGGFAQMLESTYMATHSSFFAMVSVAEQFGNLRQTLGSVLGIFTVMRWIRTLIAKITGRPLPASSKDLTPSNFAAFTGRAGPDGSPAMPRPSKKPFIVFILAVFGLPFLMGKLIRALAQNQEEEERRCLEANPGLADGQQPLDPSKLDFCKVLYDFTPEANTNSVAGVDLAVKKGDLVAVLSKTDPLGNPSEWWRCRARDGRMGYLPSPYLEPIQRKPGPALLTAGPASTSSNPQSPASSRAQTMTDSSSRAATMVSATEKAKDFVTVPATGKPAQQQPPAVSGKAGDIGIDSFQKSQFYS